MSSRRKGAGKRKARVISLGCSKNLVDTEFIMGAMAGCGWSFTTRHEEAALLVVNTCSFLDSAVAEADEAIREALAWKEAKGSGTVIVAGCLVNREGRALEGRYPGVDLFLTPGRIGELPSWLAAAPARQQRTLGRGARAHLPRQGAERVVTSRFWTYLKISDGCDNRCSYCLIPSIRGRHRSRSLRSIAEEARALVAAGMREINVVGQDITRWGQDRGGRGLASLVRALASLPGEYRLRLLYLHPARIGAEIRRLLAEEPKVFPYLDMPLQHGSDKVLRGMGRPYGRRGIERTLELLRRDVPGVALRTTVMVGFPGEGKKEFGELLGFLRSHPFENLGAFVFSPQAGTPAAVRKAQVPPEVALERYHEVMSLQKRLATKLWKQRRGETVEALVLEPAEGDGVLWRGRTAWQAPEVDGHIEISGRAAPGDLVRVTVTGSGAYDLKGAVVPVSPRRD